MPSPCTSLRSLLLGVAASLAASMAAAQAPSAPAASAALAGPPAGFVAPAEPRADDTNAQRAKSQPGNNAPFWRGVHDSGTTHGISNLPGPEKGVLVQEFVRYPGSPYTNAGEAWRQVRNHWILPYGGALIAITLLALALFYRARGRLGGHEPYTGRMIERFTYFERAAHWANAIAFCVLAVSGLVMAFGKFILLPLTGSTLFGWLTYALKTLHNFVGPLFLVSLVVVLVTFVRDNIPRRYDLEWLRKAGGMFGSQEVPSHRFNAGEKGVFWGGVFVLGLTVAASGLVLDQLVPAIAPTRGNMQVAHMIHATAAVLMMGLFIGHIYMGTVGMKGAYLAMRHGYVDEGWAKEHHELWYDDIKAGRIPAVRTPAPQPPAVVVPAIPAAANPAGTP